LLERKDQLYENLRDLNFEYRAGKYPEEDFQASGRSLENETALADGRNRAFATGLRTGTLRTEFDAPYDRRIPSRP